MNTIDFSPLFRHSIGFDRMQRLLDSAQRQDSSALSYPPYNIEQLDGDNYRITMAVAGFSEKDLDVTVEGNTLIVSGQTEAEDSKKDEAEDRVFLYQGIAGRAFERRFELADHIKVVGGSLENGLLHVELERQIPEEQKPRKISLSKKSLLGRKAA